MKTRSFWEKTFKFFVVVGVFFTFLSLFGFAFSDYIGLEDRLFFWKLEISLGFLALILLNFAIIIYSLKLRGTPKHRDDDDDKGRRRKRPKNPAPLSWPDNGNSFGSKFRSPNSPSKKTPSGPMAV